MSDHQQRWDAALAAEHGHQRELLATLRGELGTFASECAGALTALDAFVGGLAGAAAIAAQARQGYAHAKLLHDLARTTPGETAEGRSDRELLERVCNDSSVRAELERVIGPAPIAMLQALEPLRRFIPAIASLRRGEKSMHELAAEAGTDLVSVLNATEQVAASGEEALVADAGSLAQPLRDTIDHVERAARSVSEGKLEAVLAESRGTLEADLAALAGVIDGATEAAAQWVNERRAEHGELTEEVRVKLDRVERTRRILGLILPHLQAVVRALTTAEKAMTLEHKLFPEQAAAAEASRQLLMLDLGSLWDAAIPANTSVPPRTHRPRGRVAVVAAVVVVIAAAVGIALAVSGGGKKKTATPPSPTTTAQTTTSFTPASVPPAPKVSPVAATFNPNLRATFYTISTTGGGPATYTWKLTPPKLDPTCDRFSVVAGKPNEAVWHHADTDHCNHALMGPAGHLGTVSVVVKTSAWECSASFFGTNTLTGQPAQRCRRL